MGAAGQTRVHSHLLWLAGGATRTACQCPPLPPSPLLAPTLAAHHLLQQLAVFTVDDSGEHQLASLPLAPVGGTRDGITLHLWPPHCRSAATNFYGLPSTATSASYKGSKPRRPAVPSVRS